MSNRTFAIVFLISMLIAVVIAYYMTSKPFPSSGGNVLLRDELIRMSER